MSEQATIARAIATLAHRGQVDKAGEPYIGHPVRVAHRVMAKYYGESNRDDLLAVAYLHDVLEDTDVTSVDLEAAGVVPRVVRAVEALTRGEKQSPEDYYAQVSASSDAWKVKLEDIADNCDPGRLALLDDATIARLTRKYAKARKALEP